jgi:hypothetical protein
VSFKGGFLTGQSISRRAGSGGGFGANAVSINHISRKAWGAIEPPSVGGGGSSDPFKTALREIAEPTIEYIFSEAMDAGANGSATCVNTGTEGTDLNADLLSNAVTETADEVGGFDGYWEAAAADDRIRDVYNGIPSAATDAKVMKSINRTYMFVFDYSADVAAGWLNLGGTAATQNAWGWLYSGTTGGGGTSSVLTSRYLWSGTAVTLNDTNGSHSDGGTAVTLSTTRIDASTPRRTVLFIHINNDDDEGIIRWKQQGTTASGHTLVGPTSIGTMDTSHAGVIYWAGYTSAGGTGVRWRYIGIVDENLTAANFDTLADIALGL